MDANYGSWLKVTKGDSVLFDPEHLGAPGEKFIWGRLKKPVKKTAMFAEALRRIVAAKDEGVNVTGFYRSEFWAWAFGRKEKNES